MAWTFVGLSELVELRKQYEMERAVRARGITTEAAAQKILDEERDWEAFNVAVREFEKKGSDPTKLDVAEENGKPFPGFHKFRHAGFSLVYDCDAASSTARAVVFYRDTSRHFINDLWDRLKSKKV
jgi:hypothetical protein